MEMILRLLLRRLMALPVMILGVTALVFVVLQFTPGDPATVALGESASEAAKQLYRESHGLNDPLFVQYFLRQLTCIGFWCDDATRITHQ